MAGYTRRLASLAGLLACSAGAMAQGVSFGFLGAPGIQLELPSRSLSLEIIGGGGVPVDDALVTAMAATGSFRPAEQLRAGIYYLDKGIGVKTSVNIDSPGFGAHSVDFAVPDGPSPVSALILISTAEPAKVVFVTPAGAGDQCGDPEGGSCCSPNGGIGCSDAECCSTVCSADPFCCEVEWDQICADEACVLCGKTCCGRPGCGVPGTGGCYDPHANPYCDDTCALSDCPGCCDAICAADPFCCDVSWDVICANEAMQDFENCPHGDPKCGLGVGDCCAAHGTPGCEDLECCQAVCAIDPFCCEAQWDGICVDEACAFCTSVFCECFPPPNDQCSERIDVLDGSTPFSNENATTDGPSPCGDMGSDIWYNYNAGFTGELTIDTFGSGFDTVVAAYAGCSCPVGAPLACNDDSGGGLQSQITFAVEAGQCYKLQVGGLMGAQGNGVINVSQVPATGACCLPGGACLQVTAVDCGNLGGSFLGENTPCTSGYTAGDCKNQLVTIAGLPGTVMAPIASSSDDAGDAGIPIGFTFDFFGTPRTTVGIASNGYLTFGGVLGDFTNDPIPSAAAPDDSIAPAWDDWAPDQGGDVFYRTAGPAGSRTFTVEWANVTHFGAGGSSTFQAILSETSNCIEYRYGLIVGGATPTVGIEDASGAAGFPGGFGPPIGAGECIVICPAGNPCPQKVTVSVDVKPGVCPNPFHLTGNQQATLAVAIAGTRDFDVGGIDPSSIRIAGVGPLSAVNGDVSAAGGSGNCVCGADGGDGITDLVLQFQRTALQAALGLDGGDVGDTVELTITGTLDDGTPFSGSDCVVVQE